MQSIALPMSTTTFNTSLQIGDMVYFSPKSDIVDGGFDTGLDETGSVMYELGVLVNIVDKFIGLGPALVGVLVAIKGAAIKSAVGTALSTVANFFKAA